MSILYDTDRRGKYYQLRLIDVLKVNSDCIEFFTMPKIICKYCNKKIKTKLGLQKHLEQSAFCISTRMGVIASLKGINQKEVLNLLAKGMRQQSIEKQAPAKMPRLSMHLGKNMEQEVLTNSFGWLSWDNGQDDDDEREQEYQFDPLAENTSEEESTDDEHSAISVGNDIDDDSDADNFDEVDEDEDHDDKDLGQDNDSHQSIDPNILKRSRRSGKEFKKYVRNAYSNFTMLTKKEMCGIRLMHKLVHKKATLDTYDDVMQWHLQESGKLGQYESVGKSKHFVSREKLMQKLKKRYDMTKKYAKPRTIVLPHTNTKVTIWRKLARDNVMSLLTDPRWKDDDWLYYDNDPFQRPPDNCPFIEDINTSEAYLKTHEKLITKPNQILVPIPLYIDGAVTGQYDKLQVTAMKMTLGILNRYARDKEYAWKTLGYVSNYTKEDSRGKKILVESGHVAAIDLYNDGLSVGDEEGGNAAPESEVDKAADYHAILSVILESLFDLVEEGMIVDVHYRGKLYKDCELVFFVPFVKCDGDEGDKLCCSYRSRGAHVQQLCRYCQCPNAETDNPNAEYPFKTEPLLRKLYEQNNVQKLKELSQICIKNAFHGLRFGLHNTRGIHGACPWELLHAILLGIFKYVRDCFFEQIGPSSATAGEINSLSMMIGALLARQSDCNKPRTKFSNGILKGKLMAKEYTGVLLVMAAILRCKVGKETLKSARKKCFREEWLIKDWILLVETLLQWEAYLNLPQMEKKDLHRLKRKHKFLMYLLIKVGNRTTGMGFKVMKVHAMLHLAFDILMFGVPMVVDTGSNESHHKTTKVAAKLTQKDIKSFEKQTSNRMDDFHVLDLAMEEINGRPLWKYFFGYCHDDFPEVEEIQKTGGMTFNVFVENPETNEVGVRIVTRMKDPGNLLFDTQFLNYAMKIQEDVAHVVPKMTICAEHKRDGCIFRSHPNYRFKGTWRDWVMIKWEEGDFPAQIWGFIDFRCLPEGMQLYLTVGKWIERGVYAVVESANYVEEETPESDIFTPIILETTLLSPDGDVQMRKFYLVDVDTFKAPIVVIPDIGSSPKCKYLMMVPRSKWAEDFRAWVRMAHHIDEEEMAPLPPPPEEEEDLELQE